MGEDRLEEKQLVVVFGGAGYIGTSLIPLLLQEGYRVRVFDNFLFGREPLAALSSPDLEIITGDICDTQAVASATEEAHAVILLAALIGHRIRDGDWTDIRRVNYLASSVVVDAAIEYGVDRFIFASTNSVYGVQQGLLYETTIPEPVSLYSRLKLRLEQRVMSRRHRNFHPTTLRLATCHGYSPRMRFDLVANTLVRDAVCKREIVIESGEQWRAQIHVEDAARSFVTCLKAHVNLVSGEIFNVGASEQNLQLNQLANVVAALVPGVSIRVAEGAPDLVDFRLSCSKIEKVLDFAPRWGLEQSLSQVRDLLQRGAFGDPYSIRYNSS